MLDDNIQDAGVIETTLLYGGIDCQLLRVETRSDFVAAIENNLFNLILADYVVANFDGFSALEVACKKIPDVPFIFVSSSLNEDLEIEALKRGATDYVLKQRLRRLVPSVERALQFTQENRKGKRTELNGEFLANVSQDLVSITNVDVERTRVEEALHESEEKYRTLFESIDQGFCICEMLFDENDEPFDYRFLQVNPLFEMMTGLRQAEGKTARSLVPNLEASWFKIYGRVVQTGEPVQFENQSVAMNRWFDVNAFPVGEPQSHKFAILFTNITKRKKIEQERERFLSVGSDLQVITGIDGYFKWVSPTFERTLGWTVEEMTSRPWADFIHPDDISTSLSETDSLFLGNETFAFENRYRHKDGSYHWLLWQAQPYPEEQVIYGVAVDITERKQTEVALKESEEQSRNILESIKDGFFALDRNWRFTYVNHAAERLLDFNPGELLGKDFWETFPGVVGNEFEQLHRHVMHDRVAGSLATFYPDHNRWYEVSTYPATNGITIYFRDITASKQGEEALRLSESRFRLMVESAKEYAIFTLDLNGTIASWNSGAERLLGYTETEALGCSGRMIFTPEDNELRRAEREMHLALTEGRAENERWHVRKDGSRFWGSGLMMPLLSETGNVQGFMKIMQDKTAQQQAHERMQQQAEQLEKANRIKDEFLAVLSHELRSPLNPILGWSKLLQKGNLDSSKIAQGLSVIERNAKLQSGLIEDLLDVSRILQGKLSFNVSPVDLVSTIQAAMETVHLAAQAKSIQIEAKLEPNVGLVSGDANRLQQVVWNLLSNAVKFTDAGGRVEIILKRVDYTAQIIVSDTGKGINSDFLPHVFDYFRQENGGTTRRFGGLGLGLAIVRHLVELHGGIVYADSAGEGQGASFTVTLPLIQNLEVNNADSQASNSSLNLHGIKVLVVDDDTDTRELIAFILEMHGAVVTAVDSASEALAILAQDRPNLLVSDIGMPDMDGYMFMQRLKSLPPEQGGLLPAIALTAFAGEINQRQALEAGFQRHISKPIEPDTLISAIAELLNINKST
ncbi:MAG: PAS domain S-box protein [Scytonematopsis contorta HA4267-MV1]|nr:PAS domain S-box protein [Scytonematopsis contorta HA4267-MV1]